MKRNRIILVLFLCLAVVQAAVVLSRIVKWETVLRSGKQFRFRTAPVDPYDAFRGRYIALDFEAKRGPWDLTVAEGAEAFALLRESRDGFAEIAAVLAARPAGGDYLRVKIDYLNSGGKAYFEWPFKEYYLEEKAASAAEEAYQKHSRKAKRDAFVTVRVKDGYGVIEELYLAGKPIKEFLRESAATVSE